MIDGWKRQKAPRSRRSRGVLCEHGPALSPRGCHDQLVRRVRRESVIDPQDIVTEGAKMGDRAWRDMQVSQNPHAIAEVLSLANHDP
jgi:hypothetical protein